MLTSCSDLSASYNSKPWQHKLASQVSDALQERKGWIGVQWAKPDDKRDIRLLDYACGTGAITKALGPYVNTIRGIDISENMVEVYNKAAQSSGLKPEQANAAVGDLIAEKVSDHLTGPEYENFDIAVIGLGFHHFEDPALSVKRLTERLKVETGVLLIVDFLPFEAKSGAQHPEIDMPDMQSTIKHNGFEREDMKKLYDDAGLEDFGWSVLEEPAVMEMKERTVHRTIFIARGRRPPTAWGKFRNWLGGLQESMGGQLALEPDGRRWAP